MIQNGKVKIFKFKIDLFKIKKKKNPWSYSLNYLNCCFVFSNFLYVASFKIYFLYNPPKNKQTFYI